VFAQPLSNPAQPQIYNEDSFPEPGEYPPESEKQLLEPDFPASLPKKR
jgi:hypothetical protein